MYTEIGFVAGGRGIRRDNDLLQYEAVAEGCGLLRSFLLLIASRLHNFDRKKEWPMGHPPDLSKRSDSGDLSARGSTLTRPHLAKLQLTRLLNILLLEHSLELTGCQDISSSRLRTSRAGKARPGVSMDVVSTPAT